MDGGRWRPGNEVPTDGLSLSVLPDVVFTDDGCDEEELTPERWESICESAASGAAGEWAASHYIKTLLTLRAGEARIVGDWSWGPIVAGSIRAGPGPAAAPAWRGC